MLSIQSIMLVALGFLTATLLALTFAPALWSRAVRLTTRRIKDRLPVTETEIRADKDRLRAEFAMTVHRLETKIEQAELRRARHMIELNRRDASISTLEGDVGTLRSVVEEHENARRVLEHTVSERLPKVEARLDEARVLLATRDAEIHELSSSTSVQQRALDEARSINAQQGNEIERLATSLTVRGGRNKSALNDASISGEIALRSELEGLRAKSRDQAALIARLQQQGGAASGNGASAPLRANGQAIDLPALLGSAASGDDTRAALERDLRAYKAKADDLTADIKTLTAELTALRSADAANTPDSKVALRARIAGLQTQTDQQADLVRKLRAELAAANERLALQGATFMDQMRRLGAAAGPNANGARRADTPAPRVSLAERVANSRAPQPESGGAAEVAGATADDGVATPAGNSAAAAKSGPSPMPPNTSPRLIDRISSLGKV